MGRTENVELTTLCLIYRDDRILLQNRIKKDWRGYTLPGGHIEPGESVVESVIREMKEETGLAISQPRLCGIKQFPIDGGRYIVFLFKTDRFTGELRSSDEGEMEWVSRADVGKLSSVADLEALLTVMERDDMTEFQYVISDDQWKAILR
jgi:8-oxo-dGTP diphosphatase